MSTSMTPRAMWMPVFSGTAMTPVQVGDWVKYRTLDGDKLGEVLTVSQLEHDVLGYAATYRLSTCIMVHAVNLIEIRRQEPT